MYQTTENFGQVWSGRQTTRVSPPLTQRFQASLNCYGPTQKARRPVTPLLSNAPGHSNRFAFYPGFGFQHQSGAMPASFCLTGETGSDAHTDPASQSTSGSAV